MSAEVVHTAEVRWFFEGPVPDEAVAWFDPLGALSPDVRTDRYLVLPGCETVGVKERDGRFEIKARKGSVEVMDLPEPFEGYLDRWVKWSYGEPPVAAWIRALRRESAGWIAVEKARRLRVFQSGEIAASGEDDAECRHLYCAAELTEVRVGGRPWWTVGLEAVEPPGRLCRTLATAAESFCRRAAAPGAFAAVNSMAYPAWLHRAVDRADSDSEIC